MKNRLRVVLVLVCLWIAPLAAEDPPSLSVGDPAQLLSDSVQRLLAFVRLPENRNPAAVERYVQHEIAPLFDFGYMSRWVAGPAARHMTAEQKWRFKMLFTERFMEMVVGQLLRFGTQGPIRVLPSRRVKGDQATVTLLLGKRRGYPARVDFRLYRSPRGWKIFDVAANGSSALAYFRRQFASVVQAPDAAWR